MNLAPERGSYLERYSVASPANEICAPYRGRSESRRVVARDRGKPLSWNMSPFQGQRRNCHVIWLKTAQIFFMDFEHPIKLVFPYLYTNTANSRGVCRRSSLCCVKERASLWLSVR